jgi:hypothetical protein
MDSEERAVILRHCVATKRYVELVTIAEDVSTLKNRWKRLLEIGDCTRKLSAKIALPKAFCFQKVKFL